ncbi:hypothetical protein [Stratiformator vulcanicus]|uniref:hypothetical protein n=1 Tax=Stratiformator vulcanicus TaxID=2527980 RepID=UPI00287760B8|nr:hypothetical protein [Stratiformator vulcanicus]
MSTKSPKNYTTWDGEESVKKSIVALLMFAGTVGFSLGCEPPAPETGSKTVPTEGTVDTTEAGSAVESGSAIE